MSGTSIFSKVLRNENAHTELLCNFLHRSAEFRSLFFRFLTERDLPQGEVAVKTQFKLDDKTCPDLKISLLRQTGQDLLVEVKIDANREPTNAQREGYGAATSLTFLVPKGWKYVREVPSLSAVRYWDDLASRIETNDVLSTDILFKEYLLLLHVKFPSIRLSPTEVLMITSVPKNELIFLAIKLHRVVDALYEHFDGFCVGAATLSVETDVSEGEYGFNIKDGKNYLLWVGMSSEWKMLLGVGYQTTWRKSNGIDEFTSQFGDWHLKYLDEQFTAAQSNIVQKASESIESSLRIMLLA